MKKVNEKQKNIEEFLKAVLCAQKICSIILIILFARRILPTTGILDIIIKFTITSIGSAFILGYILYNLKKYFCD